MILQFNGKKKDLMLALKVYQYNVITNKTFSSSEVTCCYKRLTYLVSVCQITSFDNSSW